MYACILNDLAVDGTLNTTNKIYMYVCMHIMYVCMYVCTHVRTCVCVYALMLCSSIYVWMLVKCMYVLLNHGGIIERYVCMYVCK